MTSKNRTQSARAGASEVADMAREKRVAALGAQAVELRGRVNKLQAMVNEALAKVQSHEYRRLVTLWEPLHDLEEALGLEPLPGDAEPSEVLPGETPEAALLRERLVELAGLTARAVRSPA